MCKGVREIYHLCGHNMETLPSERCPAGYDPETGCKTHGFSQFHFILRSRPNICPQCASDIYKQIKETCESLAGPVKESISILRNAAAATKDSHDRVSRLYLRRVEAARAIIESPDADWSTKHMAFNVVETAREMMQPLMEIYASTAVELAGDLERKEGQLRAIRQHYLMELEFFREHLER